jgi:osmoprotectant transport system ATP-binding protein
MIEVRKITKKFKLQRAVDDISFKVYEGENFVLLGTSGCGKTTTLKMLNRLIEPTSGEIFINDKNILEENAESLRRGIGYVLQNTGLFPHYSVSENIAVVPNLFKWDKEKIKSRVVELMEKLHLSPEQYFFSYPGELSGGQQQRVGLARALAADPPILLMDEPFGALDPITRIHVRNDFKNLEEFKKKTIVLVTHDVQEAFELGDKICLMDKGKIVQVGTAIDLLFKPANEYVRKFFDEQRLQLEYKSVTLQMLWPYLSNIATGDKIAHTFSTSQNLWQAFEYISNNSDIENALLCIGDKKTNEKKQAGYAELFLALSEFKKAN